MKKHVYDIVLPTDDLRYVEMAHGRKPVVFDTGSH